MLAFLKRWMLPLAMLVGACAYLCYHYCLNFLHPYSAAFEKVISVVQPLLIFCMLFLSFTRIEPRQLRFHRWQGWLLLVQSVCFVLTALATLWWVKADTPFHYFMECMMICFICPTATAASVITDKLGGDMAGLITYTVLINVLASVLIPLFVPLVHPVAGVSFHTAFCLILAKVFPLLIGPCIAAWLLRYLFPAFHRRLVSISNLSFYLWSVALCLAILMSLRALFRSHASATVIFLLALASALVCFFNFAVGKYAGRRYEAKRDERFCGTAREGRIRGAHRADRYVGTDRCVSVTQSLGQKNTVFAIWLGYTFFSPVTSVTGGLYSIWQNSFNSWQLEQKRKKDKIV